MAKVAGFPGRLRVDNSAGTPVDISNDVTDVSVKTPRGVFEVTGLDKSAVERILGLADAEISIRGVFNPSGAHTVFRDFDTPSTGRTVEYAPAGTTAGSPVISFEAVFEDYTIERGDDGKLTWSVTGRLANGAVPSWSTL
jgi:hypothetical protein